MLAKSGMCRRLGLPSFEYNFPETVNPKELFATIDYLNHNPNVDGIFLQKPLPEGFDEVAINQRIVPQKDIDGQNLVNQGKLKHFGDATLKAITPIGITVMLDSIPGLELSGKHVVIVGRSKNIGRPLNDMLTARNCTTTICHSYTENLEEHLKIADIIIVAMRKPKT
eukprot:UN02809